MSARVLGLLWILRSFLLVGLYCDHIKVRVSFSNTYFISFLPSFPISTLLWRVVRSLGAWVCFLGLDSFDSPVSYFMTVVVCGILYWAMLLVCSKQLCTIIYHMLSSLVSSVQHLLLLWVGPSMPCYGNVCAVCS